MRVFLSHHQVVLRTHLCVWPAGQQRRSPCPALAAGRSWGNLHVRPLRGTRTVRGAQEPDWWEPTQCRCIYVHAQHLLNPVWSLPFIFAVSLRDYAWTSRYSVLYIDNPVRYVPTAGTLTGWRLAACETFMSISLSCFLLSLLAFFSSPRGGNRVQLHWGWQRLCKEPGWCWPRPVQVKHRLPAPAESRKAPVLILPPLFVFLCFQKVLWHSSSKSSLSTRPMTFMQPARCVSGLHSTATTSKIRLNQCGSLALSFPQYSRTPGSTFQLFLITSIRTTPPPKWRSTWSAWRLATACVTLSWCVSRSQDESVLLVLCIKTANFSLSSPWSHAATVQRLQQRVCLVKYDL